jgi:NAD(P)-dependent dehydrogenase (short-subunit alcohol dehydrogenase family)
MSKTILITGASSGIGKAAAKHFQQHGWNVIATMRHPDQDTDLRELANVLVAQLDVTDIASIQAAVAAGLTRFGRLDALLNNAGFGAYGPLEATPSDTIRRQFDTNVIGLLETTKAVLPHFRAQRAGVVLNVSSMGGQVTFPLGTLYHGTKFAVEGLSESLSFELAAIGVRVKLIEPGMVNTDFSGRSLSFSNDETLAEYQPTVQRVFAGFGAAQTTASTPETIAATIYHAATDNTDQLRYVAGPDAEATLQQRKSLDDRIFLQGIRAQFDL